MSSTYPRNYENEDKRINNPDNKTIRDNNVLRGFRGTFEFNLNPIKVPGKVPRISRDASIKLIVPSVE